jgi:hypothetical protein
MYEKTLTQNLLILGWIQNDEIHFIVILKCNNDALQVAILGPVVRPVEGWLPTGFTSYFPDHLFWILKVSPLVPI